MKYILAIIFLFILSSHNLVLAQKDGNWDGPPAPDSVSSLFTGSDVNPIKNDKITDLSSIINLLLPYALTLAGLVLFAMLIAGGFGMLTAATDTKKADAAKARLTSALIGFLIIFTSYWIIQILEIVLGVSILK